MTHTKLYRRYHGHYRGVVLPPLNSGSWTLIKTHNTPTSLQTTSWLSSSFAQNLLNNSVEQPAQS